MTELRRCAPTLQHERGRPPSFRLDTVALEPGSPPGSALSLRLAQHLDLSRFGSRIDAGMAEILVEEQYEAALEHVFGHPLWAELREGKSAGGLLAYLVETRHYLHAALWRMSPAIAGLDPDHHLFDLLEAHVIEEADHARYYEDALAVLRVDRAVVGRLTPLPTTIEWIHLMRSVSRRDPLSAAVCSGLMEYSARERDAVAGWHAHLETSGLLPRAAVEAIYGHVREDIQLGHGGMWREAIHREGSVDTRRMARLLNQVSTVAEQMFRWFGSLRSGILGPAVPCLTTLVNQAPTAVTRFDPVFCAEPVWSSAIYDLTLRSDLPEGAAAVAGCAFTAAEGHSFGNSDFGASCTKLRSALAGSTHGNHAAQPTAVVASWIRSIDGHRLWDDMLQEGQTPLIEGWLFENYIYLGSAASHCAAAIAACDDSRIRALFFKHLTEEKDHARILAPPLAVSAHLPKLAVARPLSTTVAFIGWLTDLAGRDWAAYAIALVFLQRTLESGSDRHARFYEAASRANPAAGNLLDAISRHDAIDGAMGHEAELEDLLTTLEGGGYITSQVLARASLVAPMTWSFLDGIWEHYRHGAVALAQRVGWRG